MACVMIMPVLLLKFGALLHAVQGLSLTWPSLPAKSCCLLGLVALAAALPAAHAAAAAEVSCMPDPFEAIAEVCYCGGDECAVGQYCRDEPPACHETAAPRMDSDSSVGMDDFMRIMSRGDLPHRKLSGHQGEYVSFAQQLHDPTRTGISA